MLETLLPKSVLTFFTFGISSSKAAQEAKDAAHELLRSRDKERVALEPSSIQQVVAERLRGLSGGSHYKNDPAPDKTLLKAALNDLLDDFGKEALPHLLRQLTSVLREGDYNNTISYPDVSLVLYAVRDKNLTPEMLDVLVQNVNNSDWSPQVMTAVISLNDLRMADGLISLILSSGSQRYCLAHYNGNETNADYAIRILDSIARRNNTNRDSLYFEFCGRLDTSSTSRFRVGADAKVRSEFSAGFTRAFESASALTEDHLKKYQSFLAARIPDQESVKAIDAIVCSKEATLDRNLYARFRTAAITYSLLENPLPIPAIANAMTAISPLAALCKEAHELSAMLGGLEQKVKAYPEFETQAWMAQLFPAAFAHFKNGTAFEVKSLPAQMDRAFSKVPSTKDDPDAALDPNGSRQYVKFVPKTVERVPATLVVWP